MSKGFIPVHKGRLYWSPEDQKIPWNISKLPKGSVVLSDFTVMFSKKAEAYYCKSCNSVIIPVSERV